MITRHTVREAFPVQPLGELVDFLDNLRRPVKQADRVEGDYPYYGANGQQGTIDGFLFDEPLILVAEDGGHFSDPDRGIAYQVSGKTWVNNHAHVLRPKSCVDISFLTRVLENYDVTPYISGTTRAKLTKGQAAKIEIPLPPLEEQKRIAGILDQADALRRLRTKALDKLNTLGQAIFHEMFGDWRVDAKNWPLVKLGEKLEFLTSGSRGWAKYYSNQGAKFIRIQNVKRDFFDMTDMAYVLPPDSAEAKRTKVRAGDVLMSITADLGRTAVVPEGIGDAHINQHLAILRLRNMNPRFVSAALSSRAGQAEVLKKNREGVKAGLNFDDVRSVLLPCPPLEIQLSFCERLDMLEASIAKGATALASHQSLFTSLQHRAFRGEL